MFENEKIVIESAWLNREELQREEVREVLALLGLKSLAEARGRTDLLKAAGISSRKS